MERADSTLTQRLKARDQQAMAELYDRYGRLVYAVIHNQVNDHHVTEDLVQETFLRIWTNIHTADENRSLGPWILTVARNRAIDYRRSLDCRWAESQVEFDPARTPAAAAGVDQEILMGQQLAAVRKALGTLRPDHRVAVEMAFRDGLTHAEIAERLRQPLGTVKTWVRTALQLLRTQVAEGV
jgi:RNA polymerase sigma-70 factor (ECF subfamily)